ncbi:F-box protein At4g00755 [Cornus florida]|uniref:F-box protein At4g00755 n=1 Tax=Cornus florida TaxID=4283 RepID=UPI002899F036|nr:F-box protein At4g00755 [Cornus florida]XP_059634114.1 F-box protein At4g00755 [Cornus florida]XP_059634115.1 F-box protein At4g00755 [Cornus florida]
MDAPVDFLQWLQTDMSLKILTCLDDPSDLIRASSVSRFWRHFVIANGLCKQLCLRMFPQFSSVACVMDPSHEVKEPVNVGSSISMEWGTLESDHRVYASLVRALTTFAESDCIAEAISASSTDNYPEESILHTLDPRDRIHRRASYWSSTGQSNPAVPETLIYKLTAELCVVTEISLQPFQAYFQWGFPIYSAKSVRFRVGHLKSPMDMGSDLIDLPLQQPADDKFVWTYTSQEFPMTQENRLQTFELPEPVLCIGGFLQIELLGRVQRQQMDGLFYICVSHVQVKGRSLCPPFNAKIIDRSGKFLLTYLPPGDEPGDPSQLPATPSNWVHRNLEQLLNMLRGNAPGVDVDAMEALEWDEEDNDLDEMLIF